MTLYYGHGGRRAVRDPGPGGGLLRRVAQPGIEANVPTAVGPGGGIYQLQRRFVDTPGGGFEHQQVVLRVDPLGAQTIVASTCIDEIPSGTNRNLAAARAKGETCEPAWPPAILLSVNGRGDVVMASDEAIHLVSPSGTVDLLAIMRESPDDLGAGPYCDGEPTGIASGGDWTYLACGNVGLVYVFGRDGHWGVHAGGGALIGDDVPAYSADLSGVSALASDERGNLYAAANFRILRITPGGRVERLAGTGVEGDAVDGLPAIDQAVGAITTFVGDASGHLLFGETGLGGVHRLRAIGTDGLLYTRAGGGDLHFLSYYRNAPATAVRLTSRPRPIGSPDGSLAILGLSPDEEVVRLGKFEPERFADDEIVVAETGGRVVHHFDARGRHIDTRNALTGGLLLAFEYDPTGRLIGIRDGDNNLTQIVREPSGDEFVVRSPFDVETRFLLDENGWISEAQLPEGVTWRFASLPNGLIEQVETPKGDTKSYEWSLFIPTRPTQNVDASGATWHTSGQRHGSRGGFSVSRQSPEGRSSGYSVSILDSGKERSWKSTRDGSWRRSVRDAGWHESESRSDGAEFGRSLWPDPQFGMDGRFVSSVDGFGSSIRVDREIDFSDPNPALGQVDRVETAVVDGQKYQSVYDSAARRWTITSPEGRTHSLTIDAQGRPLLRERPGLAAVIWTYDSLGRLMDLRVGTGPEARVTTYGYDAKGYLDRIEDPEQRALEFDNDDLGRPLVQRLADLREIGFGWDTHSNLVHLQPPGRPEHRFDYTPTDRLQAYRPPTLVGVPSVDTVYGRDGDHELTEIARPDGDLVGLHRAVATTQTEGISSPEGSYAVEWNGTRMSSLLAPAGGGRLRFVWQEEVPTQQTWEFGLVNGSVHYQYGPARRLETIRVNDEGAVGYTYDNDNLLTGAGAMTLTPRSDNGLLSATALGTVEDTWTWSVFAEPEAYEASAMGSPVYAATFQRDRLGRITTRNEQVGAAVAGYAYAYDLAGRLETVTVDSLAASIYAFDSNGNRTEHRIGAASPLRNQVWPCLGDLSGTGEVIVVGTYDVQDRMLTYGTCTYSYTANGELNGRTDTATAETTTYRYDVFGNLREATLADGTELDYVIDGLNRRIGKRVNGTLVQGFLYRDLLNPIAELDGSGNVVATFIYADRGNVPSYMLKDGATYRIVADHLGSVRLVIDVADGSIVQRMAYDEYGNVIEDTNSGFQPFGYAGGIYDRDLGVVRFGARDYDPVSGRWTAKDPIRFEGGSPNLATYVHANPVNLIDPEGLAQICDRRLDNLGGWIPRLGPSRHTQIWYDDGDNIGYFGDGLHEDRTNNFDDYTCRDRHYDDDLMRSVVEELERIRFTPDDYHLISNNCQSFTTAADELYRIRANEKIIQRMRGGM